VSALPQHHAADPQSRVGSAAARDPAPLVPRVRLERRRAARAREADAHRGSPRTAPHYFV